MSCYFDVAMNNQGLVWSVCSYSNFTVVTYRVLENFFCLILNWKHMILVLPGSVLFANIVRHRFQIDQGLRLSLLFFDSLGTLSGSFHWLCGRVGLPPTENKHRYFVDKSRKKFSIVCAFVQHSSNPIF